MLISVQKCAILSSSPVAPKYTLDGMIIPVQESFGDPGIEMRAALDFNRHVALLVKLASLICSKIVRCFIVKRHEFYLHLYEALVLPKFTCCCEVWRPHLRKHIEALERVQRRFTRRVAARCNISRDSIQVLVKYMTSWI